MTLLPGDVDIAEEYAPVFDVTDDSEEEKAAAASTSVRKKTGSARSLHRDIKVRYAENEAGFLGGVRKRLGADDSNDDSIGAPQGEERRRQQRAAEMLRKIVAEECERVRRFRRRSEWSPGILARTLFLGLGCAVGSSLTKSASGTRTMLVIYLAIVINEFVFALIKFRRHRRNAASEPTADADPRKLSRDIYVENAYALFERFSVYVRFFAFTAVTYGMTDILKMLFGETNELASITLSFVTIFVVSEMLGSLTRFDNNS